MNRAYLKQRSICIFCQQKRTKVQSATNAIRCQDNIVQIVILILIIAQTPNLSKSASDQHFVYFSKVCYLLLLRLHMTFIEDHDSFQNSVIFQHQSNALFLFYSSASYTSLRSSLFIPRHCVTFACTFHSLFCYSTHLLYCD